MQPAVKIELLRWRYKSWWRPRPLVLDDVSLTLETGTIHALVGANGAGKTTLLRHLTGLLPIQEGNLEVLGRTPGDRQLAAEISYLPEITDAPSRLLVQECLQLQGALFGIAPAQLKRRCQEMLAAVGLEQLARRPLRTLSKGQRRRVAFAQALLPDVRLLILDEPFHGIDPLWCERLHQLLRQRVRDGLTVLLSSHLLLDLEGLADSVTLLGRGKVLVSGRLDDLLVNDDHWLVHVRGPALTTASVTEWANSQLHPPADQAFVQVEQSRRSLLDLVREHESTAGEHPRR